MVLRMHLCYALYVVLCRIRVLALGRCSTTAVPCGAVGKRGVHDIPVRTPTTQGHT
ncbi:TPA: hypothetical protein QCX75_002985 [Bacillus mycoides]|uniref:hypothetical protein n=1 Tax=Bacillus sp. FSL P2-0099 TaxID=2921572 RepID=UPI0030FA8E19|nr:hypothetical protein [Bacillus mycoides]